MSSTFSSMRSAHKLRKITASQAPSASQPAHISQPAQPASNQGQYLIIAQCATTYSRGGAMANSG